MISAVNFQGAQPAPQQKKKSTAVATGLGVGLVAGAGGSYLTGLAKTAPKYKDADSFVKSESFKDDVKTLDGDNTKHKEVLEAEKTKIDEAKTAAEEKVKTILGEDKTEAKIEDVLKAKDDSYTVENVTSTLKKDADSGIKSEEDTLTKVKEKAEKFDKAKDEGGYLQDKPKVGDDVVNVYRQKGDESEVKVQIGKLVAKEGGQDGETEFKVTSEHTLKEYEEGIQNKRKDFDAKKSLAEALGLKEDTKIGTMIKKEEITKGLTETAEKVSKEAESAFDSVKKALPKKVSAGAVAAYAAGGAILGALIGKVASKKSDK